MPTYHHQTIRIKLRSRFIDIWFVGGNKNGTHNGI